MDSAAILGFLQETLYLLVTLGIFLGIGFWRGKQMLINVTLGLYFALLLSMQFPYYSALLETAENPRTDSLLMLVVFCFFAIVSTLLFNHLMPREFEESAFEGLGKKTLFALGATVLVMIFSFHVLPVTEFLTPGTPIQTLFSNPDFFFWWLIAPAGLLFLL